MLSILVTGGCGFIGSNFINYLYDALSTFLAPPRGEQKVAALPGEGESSGEGVAFHIYNLDTLYYCASTNNVRKEIREDVERYTFIRGNITSMDLNMHILTSHKITHIIHFAAQSHVDASFENSLQYTLDNVLGTHTLLEATRLYMKAEDAKERFNRFIHISTDEVYGESMLKDGEEKKHEQSILCPTNPYAATKAGAELIAKAYYFSYKMPIIITRSNNVYGPNQYHEKLIPRFIKLLQEGEKVTIQGDGSNIRSFLHVYDVSSAIFKVLQDGALGEIYNIGGDDEDEYTVMDVAKILIQKIKGSEVAVEDWMTYVDDRPFNDMRYYISNDKIKSLGWEKKVSFEEGIAELC